MDTRQASRLERILTEIYGDRAAACLVRVRELAERYRPLLGRRARRTWDERDAVLITYGDQLRAPGRTPLRALGEFLDSGDLGELFSTVHLLPFFPYSSDDGFSVIDYRAVDPELGSWDDVRELGQRHSLMFDWVLNHVSSQGEWLRRYRAGAEPHVRYFIEVDPRVDLSAVTRPRGTPPLTPFETARGIRHLWTTFSDDQLDLNYREPDVLLEMLDVALFYVSCGARILRLDAVAYLWKEIGTSSIHLPQTHAVVRLLRALLEDLAPDVWLLTETNVPHEENVSYFGRGDEAHLVYQFSLPPLLLDAYLSGDAGPLSRWLRELRAAGSGTSFLNFTASHDGVGVRPLESLVPPERLERLVAAVKRRGGLVSRRRTGDGVEAPYELNISYLDALGEPEDRDPKLKLRRFLGSQAIMLALRGIPAVYFHSLVGTGNDYAALKATGRARSINRRKLELAELDRRLADESAIPRRVFDRYRRMLRTRIAQPAFHPDGEQEWRETGQPDVVAFSRTSPDRRQRILVLANFGAGRRQVDLSGEDPGYTRDLLGGAAAGATLGGFDLGPHQVAWLAS
jgi:sucrose phosphorylase